MNTLYVVLLVFLLTIIIVGVFSTKNTKDGFTSPPSCPPGTILLNGGCVDNTVSVSLATQIQDDMTVYTLLAYYRLLKGTVDAQIAAANAAPPTLSDQDYAALGGPPPVTLDMQIKETTTIQALTVYLQLIQKTLQNILDEAAAKYTPDQTFLNDTNYKLFGGTYLPVQRPVVQDDPTLRTARVRQQAPDPAPIRATADLAIFNKYFNGWLTMVTQKISNIQTQLAASATNAPETTTIAQAIAASYSGPNGAPMITFPTNVVIQELVQEYSPLLSNIQIGLQIVPVPVIPVRLVPDQDILVGNLQNWSATFGDRAKEIEQGLANKTFISETLISGSGLGSASDLSARISPGLNVIKIANRLTPVSVSSNDLPDVVDRGQDLQDSLTVASWAPHQEAPTRKEGFLAKREIILPQPVNGKAPSVATEQGAAWVKTF